MLKFRFDRRIMRESWQVIKRVSVKRGSTVFPEDKICIASIDVTYDRILKVLDSTQLWS